MARWAVAVTRPNSERTAEDHLRRMGFSTYLPKFRQRMFLRGRACYRAAILFPRYLFVEFAETWRAILRVSGVVDLLRNGEQPALVPEKVIDELRARDVAGFVRMPMLKKGQKVRVTDGPFAGRTGLYQGMSGKERERVLLTAMGVRLDLAEGNLVAV